MRIRKSPLAAALLIAATSLSISPAHADPQTYTRTACDSDGAGAVLQKQVGDSWVDVGPATSRVKSAACDANGAGWGYPSITVDLPQGTSLRWKIFAQDNSWTVFFDIGKVPNPNNPWKKLANVPFATAGHMMQLTDGSILFHDEGFNQVGTSDWWKLTPDSKGNYLTGTWSQVASTAPDYKPANLSSGMLADGRVVLMGGDMNGTTEWVGLNRGAIFDPVANTWTALSAPNDGKDAFSTIADAPSVVLANGRFMFGPSGNGALGAPNQKDIAILDAATKAWTVVHADGRLTPNPETGFTLLPNDKVLSISTDWKNHDLQAEVYDPKSQTWTPTKQIPVSLIDKRTAHNTPIAEIGPSILMPNGKVFAEGSAGFAALYDPATDTWTNGIPFPTIDGKLMTAADAPSAVTTHGDAIVALSPVNDNGDSVGPTHLFSFDGAKFTEIEAPNGSSFGNAPAFIAAFMPLPNGQIMMTDRSTPGTIYVYTPSGSAKDSALPVISSIDKAMQPGKSYKVSGKQLSGLTTGAAYGDDWNPNTNYPLLQLKNKITGSISYARTYNFSSYSVAPMAPGSFNFDLPSDLPFGNYSARVVASGVASNPVDVVVGDAVAVPAPTPSATPTSTPAPAVAKKATITCVKGKLSKKVTAVAPKCPKGYSLKK